MRSQIACQKCRTSKTRCVNRGYGTDCDACHKSKRKCIYTPSSITSPSARVPKRRDSNLAVAQEGLNGRPPETVSKKRKIAPSSNALKTASPGPDLLNPQLFTRQTWDELFGLFVKHFSTDLPFLHRPTFTRQLREVNVQALVDPFASLLYAFLALTTPFHEKFVKHAWQGSGRRTTPLEISSMYAEAARSRLRTSNAYSKPSIETTQALLMLGLHEWRTRQGAQCFLTIGTAISCAEFLQCHEQPNLYEDDAWPSIPKTSARPASSNLSAREQFIQAEIKRRMYWCGFILDSYVSTGSGERRRQRIRIDEIKIQLPCSELAFEKGKNVRTMMLDQGETQQNYNNRHFRSGRLPHRDEDLEDEKSQEGLTWFIKALTVYRGVFHWVCNVTRRRERKCPWDPQSRFRKLKEELEHLQAKLNPDLQLTKDFTEYYIYQPGSSSLSSYVQLHAVIALCDMALHREYIAFLPWEQSKPAGPIDGQPLPPPPAEEKTYWEDNARSCFLAAKQFNWLARECLKEDALVETPIVGFAMFYVFQIVIWCKFFPSQDEADSLCTDAGKNDAKIVDALRTATTTLKLMQVRLPMARIWCRDAQNYSDELDRLKKEYHGGSPPGSDSSKSDNSQGMAEWSRIVKSMNLNDFGRTEDDHDDHTVTDIRLKHTSEPGSPHGIKSESEDATAGTPGSISAWNSVNNGPSQNGATPTPVNGATPTPVDGHNGLRQYQQYQMPAYNPVYTTWTSPTYGSYQQAESNERDTLGPNIYSEMTDVSQNTVPQMTPYHASANPFAYIGWGGQEVPDNFGAGNDTGWRIASEGGFNTTYPTDSGNEGPYMQ